MDMVLYTKQEAQQSKKVTSSKEYAVADLIALFLRCTQELSFFLKLARIVRQTIQLIIKMLALKDSKATIVDSIDRLSKCEQCIKR